MQKNDCANRRELVRNLQVKLKQLETKRLELEKKQHSGDRSLETMREMSSVVLKIEFTKRRIGGDCNEADVTGWLPAFAINPQKISRL